MQSGLSHPAGRSARTGAGTGNPGVCLTGIHCLSSAVSLKEIGCYQLFFDISGLAPSDWNYLTLYQMLLTELDTSRFTVEQQKNKEQELLYDCTFDELYPEEKAGENSHPMMSVFWYGLTEDFEEGLELLLELMGSCDYEDRETILRVIHKYLPDYDMSRSDNGPSLAYSLTERYIRGTAASGICSTSQACMIF